MTTPDEIRHIAKLIAFWHGQKVVYVKRGEGAKTVAAMRGYGSGFSYETQRYMNDHWEEYSSAAEQVLGLIERQRQAAGLAIDWSKPCPAQDPSSTSASPTETPISPTPDR